MELNTEALTEALAAGAITEADIEVAKGVEKALNSEELTLDQQLDYLQSTFENESPDLTREFVISFLKQATEICLHKLGMATERTE